MDIAGASLSFLIGCVDRLAILLLDFCQDRLERLAPPPINRGDCRVTFFAGAFAFYAKDGREGWQNIEIMTENQTFSMAFRRNKLGRNVEVRYSNATEVEHRGRSMVLRQIGPDMAKIFAGPCEGQLFYQLTQKSAVFDDNSALPRRPAEDDAPDYITTSASPGRTLYHRGHRGLLATLAFERVGWKAGILATTCRALRDAAQAAW
jgi:hypothetical protein